MSTRLRAGTERWVLRECVAAVAHEHYVRGLQSTVYNIENAFLEALLGHAEFKDRAHEILQVFRDLPMHRRMEASTVPYEQLDEAFRGASRKLATKVLSALEEKGGLHLTGRGSFVKPRRVP